jgi:hypothetical protein
MPNLVTTPKKMYTMKTIIYCLLMLLLTNLTATSQVKEASYTMIPLKAKFVDSTDPKEVILVFKHVAKSKKREPLIVSGKLTFSLGGRRQEKTEILGQGLNNHTITVLDNKIAERSAFIYNLIKDHPEFSLDENINYMVFTLRNITDKYVDKMTFTYGLWEPADQDARFETKYRLQIDK